MQIDVSDIELDIQKDKLKLNLSPDSYNGLVNISAVFLPDNEIYRADAYFNEK